MDGIKTFSSLGIPGLLSGAKIKMTEVLNRRVVLTRAERRISKHTEEDGSHLPYYMVQLYLADDEAKVDRVLFTASKTIVSQLDNPGMSYPCEAMIKMMGNSYCLT